MSEGSTVPFLYFTFVAINIFVLAPITFYHCRKLWNLRQQSLLSKRYPNLAILIIIIAYLYSSIIRPVADLPRLLPSIIDYGPHTILIRLLFYNSFHIFYTLVYYRTWLLFYDYTREMHLIKAHWKSQINKKINAEYYWTLKYHKYLSAQSTYLRYICICRVLFIEICLFISYFFSIYDIIQPIFITLFFIYCIILAINVRSCRDECFFLTEIKILCLFGIVFQIIYAIIVYIFSEHTTYQHQIKVFLTLIVTMFTIFFCSLTMTAWVIYQYNNKIAATNNEEHRTISFTEKLLSKLSFSSKLVTECRRQPLRGRVKFVDILSNSNALDLFALHLAKEFALENLLFLAETMQFKLECLNNGLIDEKIGIDLDFGTKIDKIKRESRVVADMTSFYFNFEYICNRYIIGGAEYCINIYSTTRKTIQSQLIFLKQEDLAKEQKIGMSDKENKEFMLECIGAIDSAMREIVNLVSRDSFPRFRATEQFKKLNLYSRVELTSSARE